MHLTHKADFPVVIQIYIGFLLKIHTESEFSLQVMLSQIWTKPKINLHSLYKKQSSDFKQAKYSPVPLKAWQFEPREKVFRKQFPKISLRFEAKQKKRDSLLLSL